VADLGLRGRREAEVPTNAKWRSVDSGDVDGGVEDHGRSVQGHWLWGRRRNEGRGAAGVIRGGEEGECGGGRGERSGGGGVVGRVRTRERQEGGNQGGEGVDLSNDFSGTSS